LLVKKGAYVLAEVIGFLRKFVKGDIIVVLRDIKFAKYSKAIVDYLGKFITKIRELIVKLIAELNQLPFVHDWVAPTIHKLEQLEREFYAVQSSATKLLPKALAELDVRLQHLLNEALPQEQRLAHAGVPAPNATPIKTEKVKVPTQSTSPLGTPAGTTAPKPPAKVEEQPNLHPEKPKEPKLKVMKEEKVPCFSSANLPAGKATEMERQLAGQQAGLNNMTAQEYLDGRDKFKQFGRGSGAPAADARAAYEKELTEVLREQYKSEGLSATEAKAKATIDATERMKTLAALHNPDMVAAGTNVIGDMGDRQVNSSIGSQWKGRVSELDKAANAVPANERATTRMNAKLERCK
jgi:Novel toxin 15